MEDGMRRVYSCILTVLAIIGSHAVMAQDRPTTPPPISGQVTFLYYENLPRAAEFYKRTLGLRQTLDRKWVKIFQLSPTSSLGLVDATSGSHRPAADKPVMISIVVQDVDVWYRFLEGRPSIHISKPPSDSARV